MLETETSLLVAFLLWISTPRTSAQFFGDLRLIGTSETVASSAGRLEIYLNGAWGTVCADGFDFYEGDIACRQLGFLYADRVGNVGPLGFNPGTGHIWLDDVICISSVHSRLIDCNRASVSSCVHFLDVALHCSDTANQLRMVSQTNRTSGLSAGRLEIFINDQWGTVCDDDFDITDADVACRQMGYSEAVGYGIAEDLGYSPDLSSPIWLDDLDCTTAPSTSNLRLCDHVGTGFDDCDHGEDVILSCVADGNLRLRVTTSSGDQTILTSSGRLEIYLEDLWGTVCDDGFDGALVACQQLGYAGVSNYGNNLGYPPAPPDTPIWLDDVNDCRSTSEDLTLLQCQISGGIGDHDCSHDQDVQLECSAFPSSPSPSPEGNGSSFSVGGVVGSVVGAFVFFCVCLPIIFGCSFAVCGGREGRSSRRSVVVTPSSPPPHASVVTATANVGPATATRPQQVPPPHPANQNPPSVSKGGDIALQTFHHPAPALPARPPETPYPPQEQYPPGLQAPYPPQEQYFPLPPYPGPPDQPQNPPYPLQSPDPYPPTQTTSLSSPPYLSEPHPDGQGQPHTPPPAVEEPVPSAPPL